MEEVQGSISRNDEQRTILRYKRENVRLRREGVMQVVMTAKPADLLKAEEVMETEPEEPESDRINDKKEARYMPGLFLIAFQYFK